MVNPSYRTLENKLRIGDLSIGQWAGIVLGLLAGGVWSMYLSPFGLYLTLISAVYLGGLPAAAVFVASISDFDLWLHVRALIRWRGSAGRYQPGPGDATAGYVVLPDHDDLLRAQRTTTTTPDLDLTSLWDS